MLIHVDPLAAQPIFEQVVHQVKGAVARGELASGDRLPSVRELAKRTSVNPNTVVRAYEVLERDGVIVRRQGAGCFVTGRTSELHEDARREQLDALVERTVTEAYHLGFTARDVRAALAAALERAHFPKKRKRNER